MNARAFGLIFSLVLHGMGAIGIIWINFRGGSGKPMRLKEEAACSIPLEVTAISDISQAPISKPKGDIPEDAVQKPPLKEPIQEQKKQELPTEIVENILPDMLDKNNAHTPLEKPNEPPPQSLKPHDQPKEPPLDEKPVPQKTPLPRKEKSLPKPKEKNLIKKKKLAPKVNSSKKRNDFISVLKDIDANKKRGPEAETPITDPNSTSTYGAASIGPTLSMSIVDRVRRLLESRWRVPLRAQDLCISLILYMRPDGTIANAVVVPENCTVNHPAYQIGLRSAFKAIDHYRSEPLPLPRELYDQWKEMHFNFGTKAN
jgi:hypothetical protein